MQAVLVFLPVDPPVWAQQFTRWALARSVAYFPTTLHVEEELRVGRPYVVGAHTVLAATELKHTLAVLSSKSKQGEAPLRSRPLVVFLAVALAAGLFRFSSSRTRDLYWQASS